MSVFHGLQQSEEPLYLLKCKSFVLKKGAKTKPSAEQEQAVEWGKAISKDF